MFTKWPRTLGLLLLSTSCSHSMADDAYIDRLAFSKNPFVINSRGSIEIAPDFKAFVAAASANKRLEVSGTSLVVAEDLTLLGEFSQSCKVMPANSFFDFVAKQVEKNKGQQPLSLMMYRYLTEQKHFNPTSFMRCSNGEPDSPRWNSVLPLPASKPFIFNEQVTNNGFRYFYVTNIKGVDFYF